VCVYVYMCVWCVCVCGVYVCGVCGVCVCGVCVCGVCVSKQCQKTGSSGHRWFCTLKYLGEVLNGKEGGEKVV